VVVRITAGVRTPAVTADRTGAAVVGLPIGAAATRTLGPATSTERTSRKVDGRFREALEPETGKGVSTMRSTGLLVFLSFLVVGCAHKAASKVGGRVPSPEGNTAVRAEALPSILPKPAGANLDGNVNVALGIPLDADPSDDYLIDRTYWASSYNPTRLVANWVAWRLTAGDLGSTRRRDSFRADTALPVGLTRVERNDYSGSGYDRGHLCPSADRTATTEANDSTFLMSNMQPQVEELNRGPWARMEDQERAMARDGRQLQIVAGGIFSTKSPMIGRGISVPDANFKIIVMLHTGQGAGDVTASTPVCAVITPNRPDVKGTKWLRYLVSVDEIERRTGYDFLRDVPDEIENVIEARVSTPQDCGLSRVAAAGTDWQLAGLLSRPPDDVPSPATDLALGHSAALSTLGSVARFPCVDRSQCCKVCNKGKACGNTCIARTNSCHIDRGCACDKSAVCP